jgi:hypothetical protein
LNTSVWWSIQKTGRVAVPYDKTVGRASSSLSSPQESRKRRK